MFPAGSDSPALTAQTARPYPPRSARAFFSDSADFSCWVIVVIPVRCNRAGEWVPRTEDSRTSTPNHSRHRALRRFVAARAGHRPCHGEMKSPERTQLSLTSAPGAGGGGRTDRPALERRPPCFVTPTVPHPGDRTHVETRVAGPRRPAEVTQAISQPPAEAPDPDPRVPGRPHRPDDLRLDARPGCRGRRHAGPAVPLHPGGRQQRRPERGDPGR